MRAAVAVGGLALAGCLDAPPHETVDSAPLPPIDAAGPDPSLVLWYPMDTPPQGGVVTDEALDHDADCADCPVVVEGKDGGGAFEFEATDSLSVQDGDRLRTPAGTWAVWARFDAVGLNVLMARPVGAGIENELVLFVFEGLVSFASGPSGKVEAASPVSTGTWVHVVATWTQQQQAVYVDGTLAATAVASPFEYESVELLIGADRDNGQLALFFDGALDDLRMYDRVLGEEEISALAAVN